MNPIGFYINSGDAVCLDHVQGSGLTSAEDFYRPDPPKEGDLQG